LCVFKAAIGSVFVCGGTTWPGKAWAFACGLWDEPL